MHISGVYLLLFAYRDMLAENMNSKISSDEKQTLTNAV